MGKKHLNIYLQKYYYYRSKFSIFTKNYVKMSVLETREGSEYSTHPLYRSARIVKRLLFSSRRLL